MNKLYNSIYGHYIGQFIDLKRKLGFKYVTGEFILSQIDTLATQSEETTSGITKEFTRLWSERRPNESEFYRYTRIRHLAQFSSYLCDLGIPSYVPRLPRFPKNTFIPYIYSQKEICLLFKVCDELRIGSVNKNSCMICMPALIRLLYCTGIRMGEAIALKNEDVHLNEGYLLVRDSKNGKQRIIPISQSLVSVCQEYLEYRNLLPSRKTSSDYFFVKVNGHKCGQGVRKWFKKCLDKAGISNTARLHDLRHTFAVTSLAQMAESGIDLYVSLPILSNYLGHQSIGATDHYVRLTSNMYPNLINDMDVVCLDVFPKFKNYEAN
ncbi:MAG: tyrosine-type recombinase/integrase [Flavobacteriaceae bacterium]|nr:tyrosine-type recombinase/integrase [Flavobacteriaceae bacterium]